MIAADSARGMIPHPAALLAAGHGGGDATRPRSVTEGGHSADPLELAGQGSTADLTVLVASSGFREGLPPRDVAAAIAEGVHAEIPSARVLRVPVIDGSESFTTEMVRVSAGTIEHLYVVDPHGAIVTAQLGLIGPPDDRTAIIEVGEAVDLRGLPPDRRDPTRASSRGVGQLITEALDRGVGGIILGCGDSGANDGGIGMAIALGVRFLDANRMEIAEAGGLQRLATIDLSHRDRRLDEVRIEAVVNPYDDLLGERGVTRVYGPGKGISPAQVRRLERGLAKYADVIREALGIDVAALRGGGAAVGLGAGLVAFAGARLVPRLEFLQHSLGLEANLAGADLVIAAAESIDPQTGAGETPAWVVRRARALGLPVIELAGRAADSDPVSVADSIDASTVLAPAPGGHDEAPARTVEWLRGASARAMRVALAGLAFGAGLRTRTRQFPDHRMATRG